MENPIATDAYLKYANRHSYCLNGNAPYGIGPLAALIPNLPYAKSFRFGASQVSKIKDNSAQVSQFTLLSRKKSLGKRLMISTSRDGTGGSGKSFDRHLSAFFTNN